MKCYGCKKEYNEDTWKERDRSPLVVFTTYLYGDVLLLAVCNDCIVKNPDTDGLILISSEG